MVSWPFMSISYKFFHSLSNFAEDFHRMNDYVDLAESQDINEEDLSDVERAQAIAARDPGNCQI